MAITNTTYLGLNKPDYDAIADIEVLNDNADIIDEQFDGTHLVTKVNNVTPVGGAVNINIGVSSVNGMTGAVTITERSVKQLIDIIYPIGSYYETTNANFNPNTAWSGTTWQRISDGRALIAGGGSSGYTVGSTYGEKTHKITTSEMPSHNHSASTAANGAHTHERGSMNITGTFGGDDSGSVGGKETGAFYHVSNYTHNPGIVDENGYQNGVWGFDAKRTWTGETTSAPTHTHTVTVSSTGGSTAMSLVQPSQAVARWLRTA